jgi:16S rRNA (guanine527-N7)-methyltransferase
MFHVEHARGFLTAMEGVTSDRFLDLGSGGGVPGLVLALLLPEREAVLLDAMARRCQFLEWAVATLGLEERVTVECGRAEELARRADLRGAFPVVVTRSFGPPAVTAECAAGFLRSPGGQLLVSEPPELDRQRWPAEGLARLGLTAGERMQDGTTTIQTLHSTEALAERYPRRTGVPDKRPLF